jgi:transcription antitermination factor NusA-like protein
MSDTSLPSEAITMSDTDRASNFFVKYCGSREAAVNFLENMIDVIDPSLSIKKRLRSQKDVEALAKSSSSSKPIGPVDSDLIADLYHGDSVDSTLHTFILLAPNEIGINSHMIGKSGSGVGEIKNKTGIRVQLERADGIPPHVFDRNVFFTGELKSICYAFQLMHNRIAEKADGPYQSVLDATKIVVPSELVAHLIGKAGVVIKKIQADSGARSVVQTEEEMFQIGYFYGRTITITGTLRQRAHAIYLVMRQLSQDRDMPATWKGNAPLPISTPRVGNGMMRPGVAMGLNSPPMAPGMTNMMPPAFHNPGGAHHASSTQPPPSWMTHSNKRAY